MRAKFQIKVIKNVLFDKKLIRMIKKDTIAIMINQLVFT